MQSTTPHRPLCVLTLLGLVLVAGCGETTPSAPTGPLHPVSGKVLLAPNQPLSEGELSFQPTGETGRVARGQIGPDGSFTLKTPDLGDGALEGEYDVHVFTKLTKTDGRREVSILPPIFRDPETTPLHTTVKTGTNTLEPFLLVPPSPSIAQERGGRGR